MDSRCVPHTLSVTVDHGATLRRFAIEKAGERIVEADVRRAAGATAELGRVAYP